MSTNLNHDKPQTFEKEPIAIIGMGCRFPGGADSPEAFWKLLRDGTDAITEVPIDRWNLRAFYDPKRKKPGKICTRYGGFIEKIDEFDADFFGIPPLQAKRIDPQHRILLEIAYEALEDGGQVSERLAGTSTGVFIGICFNDYLQIQTSVSDRNLVNAYTQLGGMLCIAANRISYTFNFTGPSLSVDTACSSALYAVHLACQSIWNQESTMALAGGVNAMLKPESTIGFSKASMLSPDGRCKSFDAGANGYVRAEGAGIVVLKPLSRALADSDPIYAVIRGSAVNSDGRTKGITMPSEKGQEAVLREAYRQAGVLPEQVQYIEAHGTGTPVGDPIEANAIGNVVGKGRQQGSYCIIGSVKSNIGHLEPASGIAGLIKAALALKYGQIPPSLHFVTPNPQIPFQILHLRVAQTLEPWPENDQNPRIAGVNSFGFGGTNAHVVLSDVETKYVTSRQSPSDVRARLLTLSAKSPEALQAVAKVTHEFFSAPDNASVSLSDICYTASLRRSHHEERLGVVADSCDGMAENLRAFLAGETRLGMSSGCLEQDLSPKLTFVFSGMGQQWWPMGRQLLECEPVFRESIKRCDELLREYADWSLWDELTASEENSRINATQIAQCCIFAVQVALSALWRSWGIIPSAIVGHSVGEVAAAHVAGVLSLEDAVRVIFHRSRLHATTAGRGKMLAIALKLKEAQRVLVGYEERVSIAVINSPTSLTLSGDTQALAEIASSLEQKEIFCRFLQVEVPYHSVLMEPLKAELEQSLQGINPQPATIPLFSTVTGQPVSGPEVDAKYWGQNMRNPVLFVEAVDGLMQAGYDLFLEIGAHPVLTSYISECFAPANQTAKVLPSVRRKEPERAMMLGSIGKLYTLGYPVDWNLLYPQGGQFVKLPSYPWQRERYWNESSESQQARLGESSTLAMLSTDAYLAEQSATNIKGDIQLLHEAGNVQVEIQGLRLQSFEEARETTAEKIDNYFYEYQWRLKARPEQKLVDSAAAYLPTALQIALSVQPEAERLSQQHRRKQYYQVVEPQLDALCAAYIVQALDQLGWQPQLHTSVGVNSLAEQLGVAEQHRRLLGRMLEILQEDAVLSKLNHQWKVSKLPELQDTQKIWQELVAHHPSYIAELKLLGQCGPHLASVLRGELDPLGLIFPENSLTTSEHLYQDSPTSRIYNQLTQKAISIAVASLPKERTIRILEIGAGTGSLSSYVLPVLPANRSEYVFTDISQVFTAAAEQKLSDYPFISYQILDIEKDPIAQGFSAHSFDLILASDAIHATRDLRQTLANVKQLLASSGLLVLLELTKAPRWSDLVFGLLKGWWLFSDLDLRQSHPLLSAQKWRDLLIEVGFKEVAGISDTEATQESLQTVFLATGPVIEDVEAFHQTSLSAGLNGSHQSQQLGNWLIFTDSVGVGELLATSLKERSQTPILISPGTAFLKLDQDHFQIRTEHQEDLQQVIETVSARGDTCRGIIHIWSLDTPTVEPTTVATLESSQTLGCFSVLHLVQALAKVNGNDSPRLFLVTNNTQAVGDSVKPLSIAQSPLWGFGRVLANEHPELRCTMVDLSQTISTMEIQSLFDELWWDCEEDEIALRGEARYVHRLMPVGVETLHATSLKSSQNQNPFRLEISTPGILDNLTLLATTRPKPDPNEVEIQVCATGLNFKDVAKAMNLLADVNLEGNFSQRSLGLECAGIITAIGSGVEGFQIGDEVIAIAPNSFGTYTTTDARFVVHKPPTLSFEEAATIPVVFLTAYYALHYLGRIGKGERVLIHAAAGGVGLAAIQMAKAAGAEIFATAGSPEKREFLKSLGVKYVMDSRSLAFADQVMDLTDGKGVDIVLNSLAGEAIPKSLSVLGAYGRFLEIGKRDIDKNSNLGIGLFQKNLSFFAVDLDRLLQERPDLGSSLFRELMQYFNSGIFHPLPHRVFPISQAVSAFRYMAQAKHIGKIVVDLLDPVVIPPVSEKKMTFSESGTYLITGGLGGFGLAVAKWLVEHGARYLVLMGRSGALSPTANSAIEAMKQAGAEVIVAKADVTDSEQLQRVLSEIPPHAPLRGIIHGAMVLDDALVVQLNSERMHKAMAPKMIGAWNLHTQTLNTPLDFFVMFSSFTSIVGNPEQGNYVAGSAFLDALAHHRRAMNLPTLTLNWGAVGDVGYVAQNANVTEYLQRVGIKPMPLWLVLKKLGELVCQREVVQTAVVDIDWHQWIKFHAAGASPRFSYLLDEVAVSDQADVYSSQKDSSYNAIVSATPAQQEQLLETSISEQVARIMGISINKLDIKRSLLQLGLDSLMAVELSHRLKSELGVNVSTMKIMHGLSISQIAELSQEQLALESIKLSVSSAVENSEEEEEISL